MLHEDVGSNNQGRKSACAKSITTECHFDSNQWICNTYNAALTCGNMPTQAIANSPRLTNIPLELPVLML